MDYLPVPLPVVVSDVVPVEPEVPVELPEVPPLVDEEPPPLLVPEPPVAPVLELEVSLLPPDAPVLLAPAPDPLPLTLSLGAHPVRASAEINRAAAADRAMS